ncbi:MAG: MaoC family dehydratase [Chitinophagales bacterium]|nr:MaoC family dehydratase [Chitinophagales bacterium]
MQKGDKFNHTFQVTEDIYQGFINIFNDRNPLHIDTIIAQSKGFASCVMHGNILNGFLSYFIGECLPTKDVIIHRQSILFKKPTYLGDILEFKAEILDFYESVNALEFSFKFIHHERGIVAKGDFQIGIT